MSISLIRLDARVFGEDLSDWDNRLCRRRRDEVKSEWVGARVDIWVVE